MAKEMPAIAYFRARLNDKAPLFVARFAHDAEGMRKHPEYFECDKDGNGLKGEVALPKYVPGAEPEAVVESASEAPAEPKVEFLVAPKAAPAKPKRK